MEKTFTWRCYLDRSLRSPARMAAMSKNKEVRVFLSELVAKELKKIEDKEEAN